MPSCVQEADVYFQLRNWGDLELPTLQYLRFSYDGWLMEAINILPSGEHEWKLASEAFPLSVAPIEVSELEEEWDEGKMLKSTALEFNCIKGLIQKVG